MVYSLGSYPRDNRFDSCARNGGETVKPDEIASSTLPPRNPLQ